MTMLKAFWLECDAPDCGAQWPGDLGSRESWFVRAEAKDRGWRRSKGRDLCPEHAPRKDVP